MVEMIITVVVSLSVGSILGVMIMACIIVGARSDKK